MCLLILANTLFPADDLLQKAEERNRHGGGIAWVEKDMVHWHKGLKWQEIKQYEEKGPPWMIHFRQASIGGENEKLCHPFPVTRTCLPDLKGQAKAVLAHNGHFQPWSRLLLNALGPEVMPPIGPWSDTRAIAFLVSVYGEQFLDFIDEKVAILTPEGLKRSGTGWFAYAEGKLTLSNNNISGYGATYTGTVYANGQDWKRNVTQSTTDACGDSNCGEGEGSTESWNQGITSKPIQKGLNLDPKPA